MRRREFVKGVIVAGAATPHVAGGLLPQQEPRRDQDFVVRSQGHGHEFVVPGNHVYGPRQGRTYVTSGSHRHVITVSIEQLEALAATGVAHFESDADHPHTWIAEVLR